MNDPVSGIDPDKNEEEQPPSSLVDDEKEAFLIPQTRDPLYEPVAEELFSAQGTNLAKSKTQIKIATRPEDCYNLWQEFSPQQTLFDTWEFRQAFWEAFRYPLCFVVLASQQKNLGLIPLWYDTDQKSYAWFGSSWQEENRFLVKKPGVARQLFEACPKPINLNAICANDPATLEILKKTKLESDEPKYVLDLNLITSLDDFLSRFNKKRRYNLRRDKKLIENQKPKIIFDRFDDLKYLISLSNDRFHLRGETTNWDEVPQHEEAFWQIIKLGQTGRSYQARMISVEIEGKIAGVDLITIYNGCYSPIKCGYDVKGFPGIGNFFNLLEIEDAINCSMEKMDFLENNYGWKEKWFEKIPLFKYENTGN